jgi:hypothetical protein
MPKALDIQGRRYGRLVVLRRAVVPNSRNAMWECQCDCGGNTVAAAANLGKTKMSCGCLQSEVATTVLRKNTLLRTDLHGMSKWPEWGIWSRMKQRCNNPKDPKYHRYGGRGIKVCERWENSFKNFLFDMGRRPSKRYSIDRIDNDGNYEKANCKWSSAKAQARNTRTNVWIEINGVRLCLEDWCTTLGVPRWKPYEMARSRDGIPAKFPSIEAAIKHLATTISF